MGHVGKQCWRTEIGASKKPVKTRFSQLKILKEWDELNKNFWEPQR